jgi:hypothetical protein
MSVLTTSQLMLSDLICLVFLSWEPTTMLASQHGRHQCQRPLGQALLVTANKDADLQCASQSVGATLTLGRLIWSAHRNKQVSNSNTISQLCQRSPRPIGEVHHQRLSHYSWLAVTWMLTQRRLLSLAQASSLRPELCWHSSSMPCLRDMALFRASQYLTSYHMLCFPAQLYVLLTAINTLETVLFNSSAVPILLFRFIMNEVWYVSPFGSHWTAHNDVIDLIGLYYETAYISYYTCIFAIMMLSMRIFHGILYVCTFKLHQPEALH